MPELSPPFRKLAAEVCATCGGPMPCALHDAQLREAILRPPEREGVPWDKVERRDLIELALAIRSVAVQSDGSFLVVEVDGDMAHVDPRKPQRERVQRVESMLEIPAIITASTVMPDGTHLIALREKDLYRWDPRRPERERSERLGNVATTRAGALLPLTNDSFLFGGQDGMLSRMDFTRSPGQGREVCIGWATSSINGIAPRADGTFLLALGDGRIVIADPRGPERQDLREEYARSSRRIGAFAQLPDGTFLIGSNDGGIVHLDPAQPEGKREQVLANYNSRMIDAIVPTSDHSFVVGGAAGILAEYAIPEDIMTAWRERKLEAPEIPPMPDA